MTLQQALARLTYKPGWKLGVAGRRLIIVFETLDSTSRRPRPVVGEMIRHIPQTIVRQVRRGQTAGFFDYVAHAIREREEHEVREWLKVDGRCMVEPHPELVKWRER